MYSVHDHFSRFYKKHVHLGTDKQRELAGYRDKNLERLNKGLTKLGYPTPYKTRNQGSYAMSTMVQQPDNDYDIDVAVIFDEQDLPSSSLKARQRVLEGVTEGGGNFKFNTPPKARTNAVTVWYAEGYHVDLAVHRRRVDEFGNVITEHAGTGWSKRDPMDITNWFIEEVQRKSPSKIDGADVDDCQMRRIVQYLKMFAKSRPSWKTKMPGGLLISVLVSQCYCPDATSDDKALYWTMKAIQQRISLHLAIYNPVETSIPLTDKTEYCNQVKEFGERLDTALGWLEPIFSHDCDEITACKSWKKVFSHEYWDEVVTGLELASKTVHIAQSGIWSATKSSGIHVTSSPDSNRFYGD